MRCDEGRQRELGRGMLGRPRGPVRAHRSLKHAPRALLELQGLGLHRPAVRLGLLQQEPVRLFARTPDNADKRVVLSGALGRPFFLIKKYLPVTI